jgi:signal transduction histidine kinase
MELAVSGDTRGWWDGARLQQLLRNLVTNAIQYGFAETPVRVAVCGEQAQVRLEVANSGPAIDPSVLNHLFDPLKRGSARENQSTRSGLGLGLFIVGEITKAHGGEIQVRSEGEETKFSLCLPRQPPADSLRTA